VAAFSFFTDNHIRQPIVDALRKKGRDVVRAVDVFGEKNDDEELFAYAAREGRVFLTNDEGIHAIAHEWLQAGRPNFRMVYWRVERRREMTDGDIVRVLEELEAKPDAFAYPIEYVKPKRRVADSDR